MKFLVLLFVTSCISGFDEPIPVDQAKDHVGKAVSLKMEVKSTNFLKDRGICFLNSKTNHRDDDNFTVVLKENAITSFKENKIDDAAAHFKNKAIVVTGKVEEYRGKLQIVVEKFEQVKLQPEEKDDR